MSRLFLAAKPISQQTYPSMTFLKTSIRLWLKGFLKCLMRHKLFARILSFVAEARLSYYHSQIVPALLRGCFAGSKVLSGPFQGMLMPHYSCWAKLLGSYEDELHGVIDEILATPYRTVVNIGAAEGYYAVGLARRLNRSEILCYDSNPDRLEQCRQNAQANQVETRMTFGGFCSWDELARLDLSKSSLIVCDVDGYEKTLLDPERVPGLKDCDMLIEVHDYFAPGTSKVLLERFGDTHAVRKYKEQWKDPSRYPQLSELSVFEQRVVLGEDRWSECEPVDHVWFFLVSKTGRRP
jgi:hypothetical protein